MPPETRLLHETVIRLLKGCLGAYERWYKWAQGRPSTEEKPSA